jgi:hypothetical protein
VPKRDRGIGRPYAGHRAGGAGTAVRPEDLPGLPADVDADADLALDSLALVWFLHQLDLRFGLSVAPDEELLAAFTSIRRITDHLAWGSR